MKEQITELLRATPFSPFIIKMSDGQTYEVRHFRRPNRTEESDQRAEVRERCSQVESDAPHSHKEDQRPGSQCL